MADPRFTKIVAIDNLRKAWIKAHHFSRVSEVFHDEYAYDAFSEHIETRLYDLARSLQNGTYKPELLRYILIPKGNKFRKIYFLSPQDSIIIQAVMNIIGPEFEVAFSRNSFGNRLNIANNESKDTYQSWQEKYAEYVSVVRGFTQFGLNAWYLITDIENYYPSISKEWLSGLFRARLDTETYKLIESYIYLDALGDDGDVEAVSGLPPGPIYSHFFSNIYLDEFDHSAEDITLGYARYVDDICFVCNNEEAVDKVKNELSNYLVRWNQKFKEKEKTVKRAIIDIEPLYDHTRKMKYATRLDFVETSEESAEAVSTIGATEKPFYTLYKIADREGDLNRLVEEASFVLSVLKRRGAKDLADVIFSLLETHPIRPSTLKTALVSLMEIERDNPSERFREFLLSDQAQSPYISTLLLRIIPYFKWENNIAGELVAAYISHPHYLVRSNAYIATKNLGIILKKETFSKWLSQEESIYAKNRLISCYAIVENAVDLEILEFMGDNNFAVAAIRSYGKLIAQKNIKKDFVNKVWAYIKDKQLTFDFYTYLYIIAATQDLLWLTVELLELPQNQPLLGVIRPLSLEVITQLAADNEIIKLHKFAHQTQQLGLTQEALIGYFQSAGSSLESSLPDEISITVQEIEKETGLPDWIHTSTCTRQLYRTEVNDVDYLSQYIDDNNKNKGVLEVISLERIKSVGFQSGNDWGGYLQKLREKNIIPETYLSQYSENQFACFYEFPSGFLPIATILSNETTRDSLSQSNIFKLGEALLQSMEESNTSTFAIHSLDPSSILWSPITGEHLLVGIGASLGGGKYFCSIPGCKSPSTESEIGISATVFHFGLLIYQLLVGHCPVIDIHNTQSRYETTKLSDLLSQLNILPHFRMILGRLLNPDPDRRYSSLKDLSFDFVQANSSRKEIETIPSINLEKKVLATLKDFVDFRLRIISRNPNMSSSSPIIRVGRVIDELANTIQYLPPDMTRLWSVGLENQPIFAEFPSSSHAKRISPEGRRLLDIAYGWEKFHKDRLTTLDRPTALTRLLLYRTLAIESLATFAGIILGLSDEEKATLTNQTTEFSRIIDSSMIQDEIEKEVALQTNTSKYQLTLSKKDLLDLQRMPNWISKKSNILEFVPSLRILGIFLVINSNNVDVFVDDIIKFRTKLALQSRTKNVSKFIWIMLKVLPTLDEQITDFYSLCNIYSNSHKILFDNNIWARFEDYYRYIHGFNPAKRKAAQVYSYQVKNYRNEVEGLIEIVSFRTLSLPFETKGTFISGNPAIIDQEILRPVLVDIIYENKKTPVLSAVLAPMARFLELPFKRRRLSPYKILSFFKGHKNLYKIIQGLSLLVLILLVWILSETIISSISGSPNPIAQGILTVVSAIFASLYGDNIKKFMNVMNPEDNDQILEKK